LVSCSGKGSSCSSGGAIEGANGAGSERVKHEELKFVLYRDLGDGYRWRLRSDTGETLAASAVGHPNKSACEADMRSFMADHHLDVEVLDATAMGLRS
jgi:uncharacterized protein YegP (UPF0339 family)